MKKTLNGKKLLAIPLCLMLLAVPFIIVSEEPNDSEFPYYEHGIWREGPFPEGCYIPPDTIPNVTVLEPPPSMMCGLTTECQSAAEEEQRIQVAILLALEENFYYHRYYTPHGMLNGYHYAALQIQRASVYFEEVFNVELIVVGTTVWHQDEEQDILALYEVYEESGFVHNGALPNGKVMEVVVAWTLKLKLGVYETHGIALLEDWDGKMYWTCIMRYCAYWMDDNLAQHEISHLLNATDGQYVKGTGYYSDCYKANCVMSNRHLEKENINTIEEDGVIWTIPQSEQPVGVTFICNGWCEDSWEEINRWKWLYAQRDYNDPIIRGGC